MDVLKELFKMQDLKYKEFHSKLIPNVKPELIIGVRTPQLRKFAKNYFKSEESRNFLNELPHKYYEENNLHAFLIEGIKDYGEAMARTEEFLPFIDNWATCDMFSPKIFKKHPEEVYEKIKEWLKSEREYTVRYAIVTLLSNYLDDEFKPEMLRLVSEIRSESYYVNMAVAWYFSSALVKRYDEAIVYIEENRLEKFVHNKAIQKSCESLRIYKERKAYLKGLKIR